MHSFSRESNCMRRIAITVLVSMTILVGCALQPEAPKRASDHLLVGVDAARPPFEYIDSTTGETVGFDVELMSLICRANRWRCETVRTPIDSMLSALARGDIDVAVSASDDHLNNAGAVAFSDPYYLTGFVLIVPIKDTGSASLENFRGRRIAVPAKATALSSATLPDSVQMQSYENLDQALADLEAGRLDGVIADYASARTATSTNAALRIVPGLLATEYYAFAMRSTDTLRLARLNKALASLLGGYSFERLHIKWFGYPMLNIAVPDSISARWDKR